MDTLRTFGPETTYIFGVRLNLVPLVKMDEFVIAPSLASNIMEVTIDVEPDNGRLRPRASLRKEVLESVRREDRERRRQTRAAMTPGERELAREKAREHQRRRRAALTPEEKETVRQIGKERMRQKRANMTPDQKEAKKRLERERMRIKRASMDPEKKEAIRKQDRERMRHKRASLDPVSREAQRQKDRDRARKKREERSSRKPNDTQHLDEETLYQEEPQQNNVLQIEDFSNWRVQQSNSEVTPTSEQPVSEQEVNVSESDCRFIITQQQQREASDGQPAEVQWQWKCVDNDDKQSQVTDHP